jgi:hypothetical protein
MVYLIVMTMHYVIEYLRNRLSGTKEIKGLYRMSHKERSVFWDVTVLAILCIKVCINM